MGIFNTDVIINVPPAFFSLQKSGLVRVYLTSVFLLLSVPRCFGDPKPQFDWWVGAANLPEEDLPGEEGVSQEEILNFWRGDGGGDAKQESGDLVTIG